MKLISRVYTISIAADDDAAQTVTIADIYNPALIQELKIIVPDTTNGVTFTFAILDPDAFSRYSIASLIDDTSHILQPNRVIGNGYKLSMLMSGVTGNAITITIKVSCWE